jgi:hypothetical protein
MVLSAETISGTVVGIQARGDKGTDKTFNARLVEVLPYPTDLVNLPPAQHLQMEQNSAARLVTGTRRCERITPVLESLQWRDALNI